MKNVPVPFSNSAASSQFTINTLEFGLSTCLKELYVKILMIYIRFHHISSKLTFLH